MTLNNGEIRTKNSGKRIETMRRRGNALVCPLQIPKCSPTLFRPFFCHTSFTHTFYLQSYHNDAEAIRAVARQQQLLVLRVVDARKSIRYQPNPTQA